jgi:hypothetical protein
MIVEYNFVSIKERGGDFRRYSLVSCESGIHEGPRERIVTTRQIKKGIGIDCCNTCKGKTRTHSELTKEKIKKSCKGKRAWNKGIAHSKFIKEKISKGGKGLKRSEETKRRISLAKQGEKSNWWNPDRELVKIRRKVAILCGTLLHKCKIKKTDATSKMLGYSPSQLRKRIESTWEPWMNWDNYGTSYKHKQGQRTWQIDHIKAVSEFLLEEINDPKIINALSNLQAKDSIDNIRKGGTNRKNYVQ